MLDGGYQRSEPPPLGDFHHIRAHDREQWKLFVGQNYSVLRATVPSSPKFRAPSNRYVFRDFSEFYRLKADGFVAVGSLAAGGLSNAWGAAVSCFDDSDLLGYPISRHDLEPSYQAIAKRIGISGNARGHLGAIHGADILLQPPAQLGVNCESLINRYYARPDHAARHGVCLDYARNAVLTQSLDERRKECRYCGMCTWGCSQGSIYSSEYDVERLKAHKNFRYDPGSLVAAITPLAGDGLRGVYEIATRARDGISERKLRARRIMLACGAIGSTKLVLDALRLYDQELRLLSSPVAAFALVLPQRLGTAIAQKSFSLSRLTYTVADVGGNDRKHDYAFGNIFTADGILASEFIRHTPLSYPCSRWLIKLLQPALLVSNCFFHGEYSDHRLLLKRDGTIVIRGGYKPELAPAMDSTKRRLAGVFRRYGAHMLPGSFRETRPGEDVHYAGTLPMSGEPLRHQLTSRGEVAGLPGMFVVDGASLPTLPAKPHTLTIMANADRIARLFVETSLGKSQC